MDDVIDWTASATLYERDDSGSDADIGFNQLASGPLSAMVARVVAMGAVDGARVIIDRGLAGTIGFHDIMALGARANFPGE